MTVSDYKPVVGDLALPATSLSLYHLGPNFKLFGVIHTLPKRSSTYERRHSGSVNSFISMVAQSWHSALRKQAVGLLDLYVYGLL